MYNPNYILGALGNNQGQIIEKIFKVQNEIKIKEKEKELENELE